MKYQAVVAIACIVLGSNGFYGASSALAATVDWVRQHGSSQYEGASEVAVDGLGSIYIVGHTRGSLGGANAGQVDGVLMKYDNAGALLWTRQFGTADDDGAYGVSADAMGNVFITGLLRSNLSGQADWFVSLYDGAGELKWTRQGVDEHFNNATGSAADGAGNIVISGIAKRVYTVSGDMSAGFVSKYDNAGNILWNNSLSTGKEDIANATSIDAAGNIYVTGSTTGDLGSANTGGADAFLASYSAAGELRWTRQFGTEKWDGAYDVHADSVGNIYVTGATLGNLGGTIAGDSDAFLAKYNSAGELAWIQQWGPAMFDSGISIDTDALGGVYVSGSTWGSLSDANGADAFIRKFNAAGDLEWAQKFGSYSDESAAVAADKFGNVFLTGSSWGVMGEKNYGESDFFLIKISDVVVPEPNSLVLAVTGAALVGSRRPQSRRHCYG